MRRSQRFPTGKGRSFPQVFGYNWLKLKLFPYVICNGYRLFIPFLFPL